MTFRDLISMPATFPSWIKLVPGRGERSALGATVVFPHAGAAAASYRVLATALAAAGDTYIVQYPQRADRLAEPAHETVHDLVLGLFEAAPWRSVAPLRLFGHSMGAVVAFEFARVAEERDVAVQKLWASAGPPPCVVAEMPELPTSDGEVLAELADLGGTDPELLADEEFSELLTTAMRADYQAFNRYHPSPDTRIGIDIHVLGGRDDHRIAIDVLRRWDRHTAGSFELSLYDGGHFYVYDHVDAIAAQVNANV
ncbi:thioesterase [Mycobacterium florentinum]|uniref:Thioesterase TesA n=1 Tax=Mycobacterium florentinum TaxID=292462 RepID=A0A1X1UDV7_MYCFL|nr:thioesterase domain-containing protein [Mycobacterium florentinum]MCV7412178.1 thioesterase [Mycobacterium florentinum]ORV54859.1 thioesterase [Mycobacterium florentinum]BBX81554.1 thioesterase [Mycobacterium florentinum]